MVSEKKVFYYTDELEDEFTNFRVKRRPLGEGYRYMHTAWFCRLLEFLFYYCIMIPVVYLLQKLYCHQKFANRKVLRQAKKSGCFLVSNHTQVQSDSYIGPLAVFPQKCFIISHPHVLSVRFMRPGMRAYGVIPLGTTLTEKKEYLHCVETRIAQGKAVMLFPEAHVWPYYTKIRPFGDQSFWHPAKLKVPMYVLTNCYQKRRLFKRPKIVTYADGPFYPDPQQSVKEAAKELRNIAYETMCKRVEEHSTCEYIRYIKKPPFPDPVEKKGASL